MLRKDLYREHEFIYCGKELHVLYEDYGIRLHFPEKEMDKEVSVTVSLNTSGDDYSLPENSELVSAVYGICISGELPSPVTVNIQHCFPLRDSNTASVLSFVRFETKHGPPCQFTVIEGGRFKPDSFHGEIDLTRFSNIGIVRFFKRFRDITYCASVYRKQISPIKYESHIVITKDLAAHNKVSYTLNPCNPGN